MIALKIKEDYKLEDLVEDFGFERLETENVYVRRGSFIQKKLAVQLLVDDISRELMYLVYVPENRDDEFNDDNWTELTPSTLYDMILAGVVEKVEVNSVETENNTEVS